MIFLTVGKQLPFDRLVEAVDQWAAKNGTEVVAQVGKGKYIPKHIRYYDFCSPEEMESYFFQAELIVSHAGMGTIIDTVVRKKPIIVLPREKRYGEHRNNHQVDTARSLARMGLVTVAYSEDKLIESIEAGVQASDVTISEYASDDLLSTVYNLINK